MTAPRLTVAVPTYNRARLLDECLRHVLPQVTERVEVVVCDNASEDGTASVVERHRAALPSLRYRRNGRNLGMDGNFLACLREARGDYVLILGDDDILLPGAVETILATVDGRPDTAFLHLNVLKFEGEFDPASPGARLYPGDGTAFYDDRNAFVEKVNVMCTFVSSLVYRRDRFLSIEDPDRWVGTWLLVSHVMLASLAPGGPCALVGRPCVASRKINRADYSFCRIFGVEWHRVLFGTGISSGFDRRSMRRVYDTTIRRFLFEWAIGIKVSDTVFDLSGWSCLLRPTWTYPSAWLLLYPALLAPAPLLRALRTLLRPFRTPAGKGAPPSA